MGHPAFADTSEFYRLDATLNLDPRRRSDLGQYMTPAPIARINRDVEYILEWVDLA